VLGGPQWHCHWLQILAMVRATACSPRWRAHPGRRIVSPERRRSSRRRGRRLLSLRTQRPPCVRPLRAQLPGADSTYAKYAFDSSGAELGSRIVGAGRRRRGTARVLVFGSLVQHEEAAHGLRSDFDRAAPQISMRFSRS
jgi:hypothetical protein